MTQEKIFEQIAKNIIGGIDLEKFKKHVLQYCHEFFDDSEPHLIDDYHTMVVDILADDCNGIYMPNRIIDLFEIPENLTKEYIEGSGMCGTQYHADIWDYLIDPIAYKITDLLNEKLGLMPHFYLSPGFSEYCGYAISVNMNDDDKKEAKDFLKTL